MVTLLVEDLTQLDYRRVRLAHKRTRFSVLTTSAVSPLMVMFKHSVSLCNTRWCNCRLSETLKCPSNWINYLITCRFYSKFKGSLLNGFAISGSHVAVFLDQGAHMNKHITSSFYTNHAAIRQTCTITFFFFFIKSDYVVNVIQSYTTTQSACMHQVMFTCLSILWSIFNTQGDLMPPG